MRIVLAVQHFNTTHVPAQAMYGLNFPVNLIIAGVNKITIMATYRVGVGSGD